MFRRRLCSAVSTQLVRESRVGKRAYSNAPELVGTYTLPPRFKSRNQLLTYVVGPAVLGGVVITATSMLSTLYDMWNQKPAPPELIQAKVYESLFSVQDEFGGPRGADLEASEPRDIEENSQFIIGRYQNLKFEQALRTYQLFAPVSHTRTLTFAYDILGPDDAGTRTKLATVNVTAVISNHNDRERTVFTRSQVVSPKGEGHVVYPAMERRIEFSVFPPKWETELGEKEQAVDDILTEEEARKKRKGDPFFSDWTFGKDAKRPGSDDTKV